MVSKQGKFIGDVAREKEVVFPPWLCPCPRARSPTPAPTPAQVLPLADPDPGTTSNPGTDDPSVKNIDSVHLLARIEQFEESLLLAQGVRSNSDRKSYSKLATNENARIRRKQQEQAQETPASVGKLRTVAREEETESGRRRFH